MECSCRVVVGLLRREDTRGAARPPASTHGFLVVAAGSPAPGVGASGETGAEARVPVGGGQWGERGAGIRVPLGGGAGYGGVGAFLRTRTKTKPNADGG